MQVKRNIDESFVVRRKQSIIADCPARCRSIILTSNDTGNYLPNLFYEGADDRMRKHERLRAVTVEPTPTTIPGFGKSTVGRRVTPLRTLALLMASVGLLAASSYSVGAVEKAPTKGEALSRNHQFGVRLGVWSNSGQLPRASDSVGSYWYFADVKDASFYAEVYFGMRIMRPLILELSAGMTNRGDVTVRNDFYDYYGNISLYPINVRLKLYPFAALRSPYQPYIMGGAGLHIGKNNIQFSNDYYAAYNERSLTDLDFVFGGGMDWPLTTRIAMDFQAAYLPMKFSKELFGAKDYSGVIITVGVKYLLPTLRGKKH